MTKFNKSQGIYIIRIKYWNASGSGSPPSLIPGHWNIGILHYKQAKLRKYMQRSVHTKTALGEVGVSLPWWCHPLSFWLQVTEDILLISNFFHNRKMTCFREMFGQSWNSEQNQISLGKIAEISEFQLWP